MAGIPRTGIKKGGNRYDREDHYPWLGFSAPERTAVSNKEEVYHSNVPEEIVKELALMKAENVAEELAEENPAGDVKSTVVIGADTIVVLDGKILAGTMSIPESLFLTMMKTEKSVSIIIRWGRPCM